MVSRGDASDATGEAPLLAEEAGPELYLSQLIEMGLAEAEAQNALEQTMYAGTVPALEHHLLQRDASVCRGKKTMKHGGAG